MNAQSPPPGGPGSTGSSPSVQATVRQVYRLIWTSRDDLLRIAAVPVGLSFLLTLIATSLQPGPLTLVVLLLDLVPLSLFAVNWHRIILLGPHAVDGLGLRWTERHTRFLGRGLLLGAGVGLAMVIPTLIASAFLQRSPFGFVLLGLVMLAGMFLFLRFALVFPAIAVDEPYDFARSWRDTAGGGMQLLTAVLMVTLPISIGLYLLSLLAASTELSRAAPLTLLFLNSAGSYVVAAGWLTVLPITFRRLTGWPNRRSLAIPPQTT